MEGLSRPICPTEWNLGFGLGANEIESGGRRDRGGGDESEEVSQISQRDFPPGWSHPPLSQNRPTPTTYFLTVFLHLLLTVGHFGRRHFDNGMLATMRRPVFPTSFCASLLGYVFQGCMRRLKKV